MADITYLPTDQGFVYLSLVTDAWSRKIVGHHVDDSGGDEPGAVGAHERARPVCLPEGRAHAAAHAPGEPDRGIAAASLAGRERLINTCEVGGGQYGIAARLQ